jgi:hypothetical protein
LFVTRASCCFVGRVDDSKHKVGSVKPVFVNALPIEALYDFRSRRYAVCKLHYLVTRHSSSPSANQDDQRVLFGCHFSAFSFLTFFLALPISVLQASAGELELVLELGAFVGEELRLLPM